MQIKKRKSDIMKTVDQEANPVATAKSQSAVPMSVSAALGSLKVKSATANIGSIGGFKGVSKESLGQIGDDIPSAKSDEYKDRIKKRAK